MQNDDDDANLAGGITFAIDRVVVGEEYDDVDEWTTTTTTTRRRRSVSDDARTTSIRPRDAPERWRGIVNGGQC